MSEKILIFGDSYSTFKGYVPEGYAVYYPREEISSVDDVSKTWWHMLATETGSKIILNNSWSGSTICNTGYGGDCSKSSSFIYRLSSLIENGFFEDHDIDRVFVFGGTNDSWTKNACGEQKFSDWTEEDLRLVLPGISYFANKLMSVVEKEKIHFVINSNIREEVIQGIAHICEHYGLSYTALSDIDKINGHPTYKGMSQIKAQILNNLNEF